LPDKSPFFFRFRKRETYKLIALTESFTWEELPNRDPDTGHLTKAGYLQKIPAVAKRVVAFILTYHGIQSTIRMVYSHDMMFSKWYPFDATVSPAYELVNLSQVISEINPLL
jgi:hypothetical protein